MKRLTLWALLLCLMQAVVVLAAKPELRLPSVTVGKSVYSNVVLTTSGKLRISIEHPFGLASLKITDLEAGLAQQLVDAGVLTESELKDNAGYQTWLKEEQKAAKQRARADRMQGQGMTPAAMEDTMGAALARRLQSEADAHGGIDPQRYIAMLGLGVVFTILGVVLLFYFLRCWCLFRIVKKARGHGSWLVCLPLLRWFPLVKAADLSLQLLWFPVLGLVVLLYQPPFPHQADWAVQAYQILALGLWAITALLYVAWCMKICGKAGSNPLLGLLLLLPLLDWIALLYLAFSTGGSSEPRGRVASGRPSFAVL